MLMDYLYEAVDVVTDARIAGVIGADGIGVEMLLDVESVPHDIRAAELELASLVASCNRTADRLSVGQVYDVVFHTDELTYLLSLIIPGYFAVLGVLPDGNMDRARFALWQIVNRCQTEL
jgi:predicted regulator of Ras-like GTPase activity (Roadblock/LC7/MglB family)